MISLFDRNIPVSIRTLNTFSDNNYTILDIGTKNMCTLQGL